MKKILLLFLGIILLLPSPAIVSYADDSSYDDGIYSEITDELEDNVPDDAQEYLEDKGITLEDPSTVTSMSVSDWINLLTDGIKSAVTGPMRLLGALLLIIIITSVAKGMLSSRTSLGSTIDIIGVLSCVGIMFSSITGCIDMVSSTVTDASAFTLTYVPIYSSVVATCGSVSSGASYYVTVLALCEGMSIVISRFLVPVVSFSLAITIVEAINPDLGIGGLSQGIAKISKWILSLISTIFIGVISVQSVIGTSMDSVGIRTAKYAAASMIPVVGGAVSDAYSTIMGSLSLIKSSVGAIGIIIIIFVALRPVLYIAALKLIMTLSGAISGFFEQKKISGLLSGINSVLSILLGVISCFTLIFIVATAVVMLLSFNMT